MPADLDRLHKSKLAVEVFDMKCGDIAKACHDSGDKMCEDLAKCHREMDNFIKGLQI